MSENFEEKRNLGAKIVEIEEKFEKFKDTLIDDTVNAVDKVENEISELKGQFIILMPHTVVKNSEKIDKVRDVLQELYLKVELIGGYVLDQGKFDYVFDDNYWESKDKLGGDKE